MTWLQTIILFAGFGFLPFWIACIVVCIGWLRDRGGEYWLAGHWYMIFGFWASRVTLGIACITYVAFWVAPGDVSQQWKIALGVLGTLASAVLLFMGFLSLRSKYRQRKARAELVHALAYVRNHPAVIQIAGSQVKVSQGVCMETDDIPVRYEITINTPVPVYAIVDVSRPSGKALFTLACITPLSHGYRDPLKDPCEQ